MSACVVPDFASSNRSLLLSRPMTVPNCGEEKQKLKERKSKTRTDHGGSDDGLGIGSMYSVL